MGIFLWCKRSLITTKSGIPVELCFSPDSEHEEALQKMFIDLLLESTLFGDRAYAEYELEEL